MKNSIKLVSFTLFAWMGGGLLGIAPEVINCAFAEGNVNDTTSIEVSRCVETAFTLRFGRTISEDLCRRAVFSGNTQGFVSCLSVISRSGTWSTVAEAKICSQLSGREDAFVDCYRSKLALGSHASEATRSECVAGAYMKYPLSSAADYASVCKQTIIQNYDGSINSDLMSNCRYINNPYALGCVIREATHFGILGNEMVVACAWASTVYGYNASNAIISKYDSVPHDAIKYAAMAKTESEFECIQNLTSTYSWIGVEVIRSCITP